jgi:hypothetical protein
MAISIRRRSRAAIVSLAIVGDFVVIELTARGRDIAGMGSVLPFSAGAVDCVAPPLVS